MFLALVLAVDTWEAGFLWVHLHFSISLYITPSDWALHVSIILYVALSDWVLHISSRNHLGKPFWGSQPGFPIRSPRQCRMSSETLPSGIVDCDRWRWAHRIGPHSPAGADWGSEGHQLEFLGSFSTWLSSAQLNLWLLLPTGNSFLSWDKQWWHLLEMVLFPVLFRGVFCSWAGLLFFPSLSQSVRPAHP